jgi:hypothetical protein
MSDSSQTKSFSLHLTAERLGSLDQITEKLDLCERTMLEEFYEFVKAHQKAYKWLHWNMRDSNYGFEAIAHRYQVLGGSPHEIYEDQKLDLSPTLIEIYGKNYSGHPRIEWLVNENQIHKTAFLTGEEEANAFVAGNFVAMHQSTLVKVQAFSEIARLAADQKLKTKSNMWIDVYGSSISSLGQAVAAHWVLVLLSFAIGAVSVVPALKHWFQEATSARSSTKILPPASTHPEATSPPSKLIDTKKYR